MQGQLIKFGADAWRTPNIVIPPLPVFAQPTPLWAYLGESLAKSQNMIAGAPAITEVGTPAYPPVINNFVSVGPTTATTRGAGYLDTHLTDDSKSFTLVTVARMSGASGNYSPLCNSDPAGSGFGVRWYFQSGPPYGITLALNAAVITLTLPVPQGDIMNFKLYIASYDDTSFVANQWNMTDSTTVTQTGVGTRALAGVTGTFTIGYNVRNNTGMVNPLDVAFAGKINQAVTLAQAQAIAANVKATLALTGMMV